MHYPDFSEVWFNNVEAGSASALRESPDSSTAPISYDDLKASSALGKRISLGSYDGKPLTWTVISVNNDMILLLCDSVVASMQLYSGEIDPHAPGWGSEAPAWYNTDVKKWLNLKFRREAIDMFNEPYLEPAFFDRSPNPDTIVVLSAKEVEAYVPESMRACEGGSWWLRHPSSWGKDAQPTYVNEEGEICAGGSAHAFRGVRPLITLKLWK